MVTKFVKRNLNKFKQNTSGIAYIWAVGVCGIIGGGLLWWVLDFALIKMTNIIFATTSFTGMTLASYNLAMAIVAAIPVFIVFITVLWGYVNSKATAVTE